MNDRNDMLFGVLDGHKGRQVADFVRSKIKEVLRFLIQKEFVKNYIEDSSDIEKVLIKSFENVILTINFTD
jgi:serine/threonine protein phosphatase PrpC